MTAKKPYDEKDPRWVKGRLILRFDGTGRITNVDFLGNAAKDLAHALARGELPAPVKESMRRMWGDFDPPPAPSPTPSGESDPCFCRKAVPGMWTSGYDETRKSFVRHGAAECVEYVPYVDPSLCTECGRPDCDLMIGDAANHRCPRTKTP